jgi:hypothetical protein
MKSMKKLIVPFLKIKPNSKLTGKNKAFEKIEATKIDIAAWEANFPYKPEVSFKMAYTSQSLVIQYFVNEKTIRAVNNEPNGSVWEDSCVEFFVSWDNGASYYNLEFNCIGTGLIGFGYGRENRERIGADLIKSIQTDAHIVQKESGYQWSMLLEIPLSVFKYHTITPLNGRTCRANFYKCGDKLAEPHFLSWSPITFHKPNFHLPEFFGELVFQ